MTDPVRATAPAWLLTLQTGLLGPLAVQDGVTNGEALEELSRRAAWSYVSAGATTSAASCCRPVPTRSRRTAPAAPMTGSRSVPSASPAPIKTAHRLADLSRELRHPRLTMVLEGVIRTKGVRAQRQATLRRCRDAG